MKGKSQKELKEIYKEITSQVTSFLDDIIKEEESDPINQRVIQIAKDWTENKLSSMDFEYLILQFLKRFDQFKKWKREEVQDQKYRKIWKECEERFCYMYTFLGCFNKIKEENN